MTGWIVGLGCAILVVWVIVSEKRINRDELAFADWFTAEMDRTGRSADMFKCPKCFRVSANPNDKKHGYCGYCHDWTGKPQS